MELFLHYETTVDDCFSILVSFQESNKSTTVRCTNRIGDMDPKAVTCECDVLSNEMGKPGLFYSSK